MSQLNWDNLAAVPGLAPVLDPRDSVGTKNALIDQIHWLALKSKIQKGAAVLDFGCGIGRFASRIRGLGATYVGVDQSLEMVRIAGKKAKGPGVSFAHFDGQRLPFPGESFSTCVCCCVLQYHSKTDVARAMIREMRRVLKPGGGLVLLEQVSASGNTSGSVSVSSTENDYQTQLGDYFKVKSVTRIRASSMTRTGRILLKLGRSTIGPSSWILPVVARLDTTAVRFAGLKYLERLPYYDVLFEATAR